MPVGATNCHKPGIENHFDPVLLGDLTKCRSASHGTALFSQASRGCLGRERFAASAALTRVRIGDLESARGEAVAEIDDRAVQVLRAEWVDQYGNTVHFGSNVIRPLFVEGHRILHPGTAALLDINAQGFTRVFRFFQESLHLAGGVGGQVQDWIR